MLVDFSVQNFLSFNSRQELSLLASTTKKENYNLQSVAEINDFGIKNILKSAAIFGANASGKTNLTHALVMFKSIVLESLESIDDKVIDAAVPFLMKSDFYDIPTEFEVSFIHGGKFYRYGIAIENEIISEEWLYWNKKSRETMLFHRSEQEIEFNQRSFPEAKDFVKKDGDKWVVEKTKSFVPFISVLAQFDGEKATDVTSWFRKLNIVSGLNDSGFKRFTINLFDEDPNFKIWALEILKSLQIDDVEITEVEKSIPEPSGRSEVEDAKVDDAINTLHRYLKGKKFKEKQVEVLKTNKRTGENYKFPMSLESEGTCKLIYLLGPLYDVITNQEVLVVDEFDNKFHTLLCKYIVDLYSSRSAGMSQLIMTCHDTNLLSNDLFRRDQIWFVEKNEENESELYSLVEYKEYYAKKRGSYSSDYLAGKYGAIPLFQSVEQMGTLLNG